ncbi:MAG: hypothetical protein HQ483_19420 [Rhodospirillales bacterium]|nr:hypothetical protein [Rhodospirillales bacterium]
MNQAGENGAKLETAKQKFYDFVRIQAIEANMLSREDEKNILSQGITKFDLNFNDAHGVFLSAVAERNIALASDADHHIEAFFEQMMKRGKISKKHFEDAVSIYKRLTNGRVPDADIRKRAKEIMLEHEWRPRGTRFVALPGSRRWFNKI